MKPPTDAGTPARQHPRRRGRPWRILGYCLVAATLAASGLCLLALFNPFSLVFMTEFCLANGSNENLLVTPIGMREGSGEYMPLPLLRKHSLPVLWAKNHSLPLPAAQTVTVVYDWDDVNFRHVLVQDAKGTVYVMDTDRRGNLHGCYANQETRYTIPSLHLLRRAPAELYPLLRGERVRYSGAKEYR